MVISLPLAFLMLALEIPLQIKFGQEKSRIVSILLIGGMSVAMGLVSSLNEIAGVNVAELLSSIAGLGIGGDFADGSGCPCGSAAVVLQNIMLAYGEEGVLGETGLQCAL